MVDFMVHMDNTNCSDYSCKCISFEKFSVTDSCPMLYTPIC